MAYFERRIETQKVTCIICRATCAEPTIMRHRAACSARAENKIKFERGDFEKCELDNNHIVRRGMMDLHQEFCLKYQSQQVENFQGLQRNKSADESADKLADKLETKLQIKDSEPKK